MASELQNGGSIQQLSGAKLCSQITYRSETFLCSRVQDKLTIIANRPAYKVSHPNHEQPNGPMTELSTLSPIQSWGVCFASMLPQTTALRPFMHATCLGACAQQLRSAVIQVRRCVQGVRLEQTQQSLWPAHGLYTKERKTTPCQCPALARLRAISQQIELDHAVPLQSDHIDAVHLHDPYSRVSRINMPPSAAE